MTTPADELGGFRRVGEDEIFRGWLFSVAEGHYVAPDGHRFERFIVQHPGAVAVVAVDDHRRATLVRQLRPAVWKEVLEIPAGTCDVAGEALEATARRELAEEAGLEANSWAVLASVHNSPGYSSQLTTLYLATGLGPCATARDGVEERWMTTELVALDDVEELVATGALEDATTICGLLLARAALAAGTGDGGGTGGRLHPTGRAAQGD